MARLKDMKIEREEKDEPNHLRMESMDYPFGLCLSLTEKELDKLGLDDEVEAGDYLHGVFMGKVTSVSKRMDNDEYSCRIELQIVAMGLEDENIEAEDEDDEE